MVEAAPARTRHVGYEPVEDAPVLLVLVETLVEEGPQESPALGAPEPQRTIQGAPGNGQVQVALVFEVGDHVAHGCGAQSHQGRILAPVDHLVDLAGLESPFQQDVSRVGHRPSLLHSGEPPAVSGNGLALSLDGIPDRHGILGGLGIGHGIGNVVAVRENVVVGAGLDHEVASDQTGDGVIGTPGDCRVDTHVSWPVGRIQLPAQPHERESLAHEEPVSEILTGLGSPGVPGQVEKTDHGLSAPVGDLVENGAVASLHLHRFQEHEIGGELHLALIVAGRLQDVGDDPVGSQIGVDGEVHASRDQFVGAYQRIGLTLQDRIPFVDLHPDDAGPYRSQEEVECGEDDQQACHTRH